MYCTIKYCYEKRRENVHFQFSNFLIFKYRITCKAQNSWLSTELLKCSEFIYWAVYRRFHIGVLLISYWIYSLIDSILKEMIEVMNKLSARAMVEDQVPLDFFLTMPRMSLRNWLEMWLDFLIDNTIVFFAEGPDDRQNIRSLKANLTKSEAMPIRKRVKTLHKSRVNVRERVIYKFLGVSLRLLYNWRIWLGQNGRYRGIHLILSFLLLYFIILLTYLLLTQYTSYCH